jgi:hypothetical protein
MFEQSEMDDSHAKELLADILDDGEIVRKTFKPARTLAANPLSEWEKLRDELLYRNRFFPDANIDLERLQFLLSQLSVNSASIRCSWHRARIQTGEMPFGVREMGAPPKRIASHGRANPAGIPYLYLGSNPLTSISEIRPHTGEIACVAEFTIPSNATFIDLRSPKRMVSPFVLEDEEAIVRMRSDLPFLERLGDELTRPVLPQAAAIDYTPSQYLCEFIKKCGYKGVVYRSSVSDGINLALFDPELAKCGSITQYRVASVSVGISVQADPVTNNKKKKR